MRVRPCRVVLAVLGASFAALPAHAQSSLNQGVPVPRQAGNVDRKVDIGFRVDALYDSNVARSSAARAAIAGLVREDVVITPVLDVDITLPFGRNTLTMNGGAGYDFNVRNTRRNSERIALGAGLTTDLRICETSFDAGLSRARSNFSNFVGGNAAAFVDNIETTTDFSGQLSCGSNVGLRPFVSGAYSIGRNTQSARQISDYDTVSYGGGITYRQPSIGEIGIVGSIDDTDYIERPDGSVAFGRTRFSARSIGVFFARESARVLQARVRVNYTDIGESATSPGFSGLSGEAVVRLVPSGRIAIEASAARAAVPSLVFNVDYIVETAFAVGARAPIGPKVSSSLRYEWHHRDYFGGTLMQIGQLDDDVVGTVSGELAYQATRRVTFTLGAYYEKRTANDSSFDYESVRGLSSARITF